MRNSEEGKQLGERLRAAATAAGLASEEIGSRLGVSGAAVRQWWAGTTEPSLQGIRRYASITGVSAYWLITGEEDPGRLLAALGAARQLWARAVEEGEDAAAALERLMESEALFSAEDRRLLSESTEEIRRYLVSVDGREWVELTPEQHRVVSDLIRLLEQQRRGDDQRDPGSSAKRSG